MNIKKNIHIDMTTPLQQATLQHNCKLLNIQMLTLQGFMK